MRGKPCGRLAGEHICRVACLAVAGLVNAQRGEWWCKPHYPARTGLKS